ncbi:phosphoribosyl-AMP cyclohydrolase [Pelagicoccus sp. SDUM812003]|uniref:phosphoribosyl-AMP cyclohydrolase n=1 Tax=Pelagicoccus sp. SDUM812003 TaxID=3041267 RepID=UPI00280CFC20|nr:phosphoribosyl-AMP cyclohydrolase [Pelagicoccus sp. SDUM812003]MDQ8204397.1 phosphoribosyl-AMP cyclohydrolase [Pelagicoccus sp. SDUM812003]
MSQTCIHERTSKEEIEKGLKLQPKFDANGLIPCITTEVHTNEVIMFAWMNEEALRHTIETNKATYFSRSRGKLWVKGESSGQIQWVKELRTDCDQDVILIKVDIGEKGAACHTGYKSCFYRKLDGVELIYDGGEPLFDPAEVYKK